MFTFLSTITKHRKCVCLLEGVRFENFRNLNKYRSVLSLFILSSTPYPKFTKNFNDPTSWTFMVKKKTNLKFFFRQRSLFFGSSMHSSSNRRGVRSQDRRRRKIHIKSRLVSLYKSISVQLKSESQTWLRSV